MSLFTPDLFRHFAFGFVAGAVLVGASGAWNSEGWTGALEAPAKAASPHEASTLTKSAAFGSRESGQ